MQIKEKLVALTNQRNAMLHRWEERWEHLQLSKMTILYRLITRIVLVYYIKLNIVYYKLIHLNAFKFDDEIEWMNINLCVCV